MNRHKFLLLFLAFGLLNVRGILGQELGPQTSEQLSQEPTASRIIQLVRLINGNDEVSPDDIKRIFSKDLIERAGQKRLASIVGKVRENDGQLEVYDANRVEKFKYTFKALGIKNKQWLDIVIRVDDESPHKICGIDGITTTDIGAKAKRPVMAIENRREFLRSEPTVSKETLQQLDDWLEKRAAANKFSGVVLVAKDFKPVYQKAFGMASKRYQVPNEPGTLFRLGSVNKIFTATAVLQLVERGKLSLDDKLHQYIDGFADPRTARITIRQLLSHSSGWKAYWSNKYFVENFRELRSVDDYLKFIKEIPLDFEPGTKSAYSNTGYEVLGGVIEAVSGQSYDAFLYENVFAPAKMESTKSLEIDHIAPGLATGYTNRNYQGVIAASDFRFENTLNSPPKGTPAGGGCSTAGDLLKFVEAVARHKIVGKESERLLRSSFAAGGIPRDFIFHNGGAPGQGVWMQTDVVNGYSIIVIGNYDYTSVDAVVKKIGKLFNLPLYQA